MALIKTFKNEITPIVSDAAYGAGWDGGKYVPTLGTVYAKISSLSFTNLSGVATIGQGGTGQTTKAPAFNALSPITTLGDLIYGSATNTSSRLAGNATATKKFLTQTGTGSASAAPAWDTIAAADVPSLDAAKITTGTFNHARLGSGGGGSAKFLREDSTWQTVSVSPGGSNTHVQFNNSGVFGGSSALTFNGTKLNVGGGSATTSFEVQRADNTNYAAVIENSGGVGRALWLKAGNFSGQKVFLIEVAGTEIASFQAGAGPTLSMTTADNTYYTTSFKNSGGAGKVLYLETGGLTAQCVLQVNTGGTNIFRVNSNGTPAYFDAEAADNTNFIGYLKNSGGSGRVLKLVTASSSASVPLIEALGSTSTNVFSLFASGLAQSQGDFEFLNSAIGIILKDTSGGRWRVSVNTSGVLVTTSI